MQANAKTGSKQCRYTKSLHRSEDKVFENFKAERYASYNTGIGLDIVSGKATLESLSEYALKLNVVEEKKSGAQEYLESVINQIMFGGAL